MDNLDGASRDSAPHSDQLLPMLLRVHERLTTIEERMATKDDLSREVTSLQARVEARPSMTFVVGTVLSIIGVVLMAMVAVPYLAS